MTLRNSGKAPQPSTQTNPTRTVSKTVFDHTSIIKTILTRFCAKKDGSIPKMGARVAAAKHLGELLTEQSPRKIKRSEYQPLLDAAANRARTSADAQEGRRAMLEKRRPVFRGE